MEKQIERRHQSREHLAITEVGILYPEPHKEGIDSAPEERHDTLLVYVLNFSDDGALLESSHRFKVGSVFDLWVRLSHEKVWMTYEGKVIWVDKSPTKHNHYLLGVQLQTGTRHQEVPRYRVTEGTRRMYPSDLEFLMRTKLFEAIPQEAKCPLLNCMNPKNLKAGEKLICQGEEGDRLYIIQDGFCVVYAEKGGIKHAISRLGSGDIVGEIGLLTGERRTAHVDAETDMHLWSLNRLEFDLLCNEYPDLRSFLTELVSYRFSTERLTTDRIVGKYVINEILGRGSSAIVYKGIHTTLNMPVAIKMLKHDMAMDPDFSKQFIDEAKTIARLNHENVVKVYDIEQLYRTFFIIMEYLEGVPLEHVLEEMPRLPLHRALDILLQVCAGLAYAHEHGLVHRDVKPGNIFVQTDDRAKIVDFGLACPTGSETGLFEGTLLYMSPEQIEGEFVDERTDIYSLGIMAYEMITGQRPFPKDDFAKVMNWHLHEDIPDPRTLVPDLPDEFRNFLIRATRKDPGARYKNIWQIVDELGPLAERVGAKRRPLQKEQWKMMGLFLFYQDRHQLTLNRLLEDFTRQLRKMGIGLKVADLKDVHP